MAAKRKPTTDEVRLLRYLVKKALLKLPANWENDILVQPLDNAGMGSLLLFPKDTKPGNREFGSTVAEVRFRDEDRVYVIASLNLDESGQLYELDIWKTTFDPLIKIPDEFEDI